MTRAKWKALIKAAPSRLTPRALARHLGKSHHSVRKWALIFGYKSTDGRAWDIQRRRMFQRVRWEDVPWKQTNAAIGRIYGVSREIVRRRRKEYANGNHRNIQR